MKKNLAKNKKFNTNQKSFFFEDYFETNLKNKKKKSFLISEDRLYLLFFFFFSLILIFSIKITAISLQSNKFLNVKKDNIHFKALRRDIVDRNGQILSRNIQSFHAAVRSDLIKDKKNFLIKIKLIFPNINSVKMLNQFKNKKYFYLKKRLTENERNKLWSLGEKGIIFEPYQSRIYPQRRLFSHILGQIDNDNYGISGVEKYFDKNLKDKSKKNEPLVLSLDNNLQYIVKSELNKSIDTFKVSGAAGLLMNANTGEVLSLVSLPDYNINKRTNIVDKNYTNKITKGLYELGSVFKTFTVALALHEKILDSDTVIEDISQSYKCSVHQIKDIHEFPKKMTVADILIQSSNVGSLKIAQKIGKEKYKKFLEELNLLTAPEFELNEISTPLKVEWKNDCTLESVSYGHGIMTTPLQVAAAYSTIANGGYLIKPSLKKINKDYVAGKKIISEKTSSTMNNLLRKVVTNEKGTASLANIFGYQVGGKTGTAQNYKRKGENINTFIAVFPSYKPKYILLVMLDNPKPAPELIYNYRGKSIKVNRNEAGWNSVYIAGKIIEKIGPILAINNNEFNNNVAKKIN